MSTKPSFTCLRTTSIRSEEHRPPNSAYFVTAVVRVPGTLTYHVRLVAGTQREEFVQCREFTLARRDGTK